ncbi:uncharacterized protein LOC134279024, partial [Saccostrea cucullata]|uniref:uncharacterized protein LOC134279024 n=1 Tax=Saccostrea cuccullata TaxID=36930 RepID=UPI002ED59A99
METYVDSCPHNITEVLESSARLGCGQDKYGNDQYLCVPNTDKTGLIELCYNGTMGLIKRGNCLETDGENLHWNNCLGFLSGCPENEYRSNEIYKYSACQIINAQHNCYLAESSCPNITWNIATSNTTQNLQPTTSSPETSSHVAEIVGGLVTFLAILTVILILAVFLWKRKRSQKTGIQELSIRYEDAEVKELLLVKGDETADIIKTAEENDNNTQEQGENDGEMEAINEISNDPKQIELSIPKDITRVEVKELLLEEENATLDIIKTGEENDNNTQEHKEDDGEIEDIVEISNDPKQIEMSIRKDNAR